MSSVVPIESLFFSDAGPHVVVARRPSTARGPRLEALLASGIAALTPLGTEPFSPPATIVEDAPPISDYLYRGRAALARAIEIRNDVQRGKRAPLSVELEELFALLDLAAVE